MHKQFYTIPLMLLLVFFMNGCNKKEEELKIGISPWPGYEALIFAMEKGFYNDLNVRIIRFATPSESFRALRDNVVDVAAFTADEVLRYAQMKNQPKIFLILDISNGGDAIVARPEIKSLNDLKGKRVSIEPSALGDYLIHRAMDFTDDLTVNDFKISTNEIGKQVKLYKAGQVDALVTYEPFSSQLIKCGAHVIFDSTQIPNEIVDILVTEDKTLKNRSEALKKVIKGWYKALEYIKNNKQEAMMRMASYEHISADAFEKSYDMLTIPSKEETRHMLNLQNTSFKNSFYKLSELMHAKGTIKTHINTTALLDVTLLEESE